MAILAWFIVALEPQLAAQAHPRNLLDPGLRNVEEQGLGGFLGRVVIALVVEQPDRELQVELRLFLLVRGNATARAVVFFD